MRLHEHEAKALFGEYGIPAPRGELAYSEDQARQIADRVGGPTVVKAQVLAGGRGRAGGILTAEAPAAAARCAGRILAAEVRGLRPEGVLVEERLDIERELYVGITVDRVAGRPALVASSAGGVDIEELAATRPEALARSHQDPLQPLAPDRAEALAVAAGLQGDEARHLADIICRLYRVFSDTEAVIAEINPVARLADGRLVAADAVLEIDDTALFRQPRWADRSPAADQGHPGMTFVELDGEIGLVCSGAGLGMATMDLIADRARPANFLETGGGITRELMAAAMRRVLERPGLRGILINVYGGINPIHEGARGVAEVMAEGVSVPVVAKALGHREEETWAILEEAGVHVVRSVETEDAVAAILRRAGF